MVKYLRLDYEKKGVFTSQSAMPDDMAEEWKKGEGAKNISNLPWPNLVIEEDIWHRSKSNEDLFYRVKKPLN